MQVELRGKLLQENNRFRMAIRSLDKRQDEDKAGSGAKVDLIVDESQEQSLVRQVGLEVMVTGFLNFRPSSLNSPGLSIVVREAARVNHDPRTALTSSPLLNARLDWHRAIGRDEVRMSWRPREDLPTAAACTADLENGKVTTEDLCGPPENAKTRELSGAQVASIRQLITKLPPSVDAPVLKMTLLITFRDQKGNVKTNIYDRRNLPPEVLRLYDLTGAQLESGSNVKD
jgi:hypothetical protein